MSAHSFDPKIAKMVGLNAAVIHQNLKFWCEKNEANGMHFYEGRYWTYNSVKAFDALFPYLSSNQIRTALDKLEDAGLILSGNFNSSHYDRTKWFCVKTKLHLGKNPNQFGTEPEPIPDSKPDNKPDIKPSDLFSENLPEAPREDVEKCFDEFWNEIWPSHPRKAGKADCRKVYLQAVAGKHPKAEKVSGAELNNATRAYIASVRDPQFLKGPLPWLRLPGWEPFLGQGEVLTDAQRRYRAMAARSGHQVGG